MVLVTGANGFLGAYLTRYLIKNQMSVRILVRKDSKLDLLRDCIQQVEIVYGDILDIPSLDIAFRDITQVYHSAAMISFNPSKKSLMLKTNIEGTANIVNQCLLNNHIKLVHVSSIAALGHLENGEEISEKTPWNQKESTNYGYSKYYAELEVYRGMAEGLNAVIVNPGMIFGGGYWDAGVGKIVAQVYHKIGFYTSGSNGVVDVRDVATIMNALMNSNITGEKFIVVAENRSFKSIMESFAHYLQVPSPRYLAPRWMIYIYSIFESIKSKILQKELLISKETAFYTLKNYHYNSSKLINHLGFKFIPFEETLKATSEAYLESIAAHKNHQLIHI